MKCSGINLWRQAAKKHSWHPLYIIYEMEKDRNSIEVLRSDISFIDDMQSSLRNADYEAVTVSLSDWKSELRDRLREKQREVEDEYEEDGNSSRF